MSEPRPTHDQAQSPGALEAMRQFTQQMRAAKAEQATASKAAGAN